MYWSEEAGSPDQVGLPGYPVARMSGGHDDLWSGFHEAGTS